MGDFIDIVVLGGPLMVPILVGSVLALAVFLARLHALGRARVAPPRFAARVFEEVEGGRIDDALVRCEQHPSSLARVLGAGLRHAGQPRAGLKERMQEVGRDEAVSLEKYLGLIGVIATISPLLGLLGTVTGMIGVFQGVVTEGVGDPSGLASGIWEALITTAAGLSAAIPAYLGWRYLMARTRSLIADLERAAIALLDRIAAPVPARGRPDATVAPEPERPGAAEAGETES